MVALSYSPEPERFVSVEEYLKVESQSEERHEYLDGRVWAMAGGSARHSLISFKVSASIGAQLRGSSCEGFSADMRVHIPGTALYTYPDMTLVCSAPEYNDAGTTLLNPTVIIEVLSPSTEAYDRNEKWLRYQRLASLRDYLLVAQHEPRIEHYARQDDGSWRYFVHRGLQAEFALSGAAATVRLSEVYENISFDLQGSA